MDLITNFNWVEVLGWIASFGIVFGFFLNSSSKFMAAFLVWIVADLSWILYDSLIDNWSHMTLSIFIIFLNLYGIWKLKRK